MANVTRRKHLQGMAHPSYSGDPHLRSGSGSLDSLGVSGSGSENPDPHSHSRGFGLDPSSLRSEQSWIPGYLPEKVPAKSVRELYPAVYGKLFSRVLLPGKGGKPRNCRSWTPTFFCPNCGKPHFTKGNCKKATCPDCEVDWRFDRCQSIMERVLSLKVQRGKRCRHFVVSPEPEDYPEDLEGLKQLRRDAYEFAKEKGVEGGVVIFHPFRILPEAKDRLWNELESDGDEFKLWKKLLEKDWNEILSSVYFAPHFHIIGVGSKGDHTFEEAEESDRFIWKGVGELSDSDDLGKATMYLLSHAGVFEESHYSTIVWFGSLSSSKWSLDRAVAKLRNGSTVKEFTLDLVEDFISETHEVLSGSLECPNCGAGLIHISSAPDYWDKKDLEFEAELKVAYDWWLGSIPPPGDLGSESDCWEFLRKSAFEESKEAEAVSNLVRGSSCLCSVGEVEKLGVIENGE